MKKNLIDRIVIYIVLFFFNSGYFLGLLLFYNAGISGMSRYYTVPLRLFLIIIMIFYVYHNLYVSRRNSKVYLFFLLFSFIYVIKMMYTSSINAVTSRMWYEYLFYYFSFSIMPFVFFSSIDLARYKNIILNALISSGFLLSIFTIYTYGYVFRTGGIGRISLLTFESGEVTISPLALAYSGAITILLIMYRLIYENIKGIKLVYYITNIILSFIIFLLGSSRGAFVVLIFGSLAYAFFGKRKMKFKFTALLLSVIPIVIYGVKLTGSNIFDRITSTIAEGDSGREQLYHETIQEFLNYPLWGGRIEVSGTHPHNIFLEILMATGLIGFFLFIPILYISLKRGYVLLKIYCLDFYLIPILIFIWGITQHFVSGSLWGAISVFAPLGMLNSFSHKLDKSSELYKKQ